MTIDMLASYGANVNEGLQRCMNNESFYLRMVKMLLDDKNFQKLYDSIEAGDLTEAFEAAHALKGSSGNLALTPIFEPVNEITELLRVRTQMDYAPLVETIRDAHNRLCDICAE